jgi:hypothetical protein
MVGHAVRLNLQRVMYGSDGELRLDGNRALLAGREDGDLRKVPWRETVLEQRFARLFLLLGGGLRALVW